MSKQAEIKAKELAEEIWKLHDYINQHMSRAWNVESALGKPGCKMFTRILQKAYELNTEREGIDSVS